MPVELDIASLKETIEGLRLNLLAPGSSSPESASSGIC